MAQNSPTPPTGKPKPSDEYATMLAMVLQGDITADLRAFRIAGAALVSGPHASRLEQGERATFNNLMASGNFYGALDSANRALDRNYASLVGHFDAMIACRALRKMEEAAIHERLLNAWVDSIQRSGDGKEPETAWFIVTTPEEYLFLSHVLELTRKSQTLVTQNGHAVSSVEAWDRQFRAAKSILTLNIGSELSLWPSPWSFSSDPNLARS
jgi:hypothetical protein